MKEIEQPLRASDVIGREITAVFQTYRLRDEWLDECDTFFRLDTGLVIWMAVSTICKSDLPDEAKELVPNDPEVRAQLIGQVIKGVYVDAAADVAPEDQDIFIKLGNGRYIHTELMAPHGTGGAGMWIDEADDPPFEAMKRYSFTDN